MSQTSENDTESTTSSQYEINQNVILYERIKKLTIEAECQWKRTKLPVGTNADLYPTSRFHFAIPIYVEKLGNY
jgi:hypothetical protein